METRVFTTIHTDVSDELEYHFEWHFGKTVNVVNHAPFNPRGDELGVLHTFSFMEQPTLEQVVEACEAFEYDG